MSLCGGGGGGGGKKKRMVLLRLKWSRFQEPSQSTSITGQLRLHKGGVNNRGTKIYQSKVARSWSIISPCP